MILVKYTEFGKTCRTLEGAGGLVSWLYVGL